jgi:parvulin-like peptidyl-prolyl isomerase
VRCGPNPQTEQVWQEIARIGEGKYFSIAQNGGVISVATPYDAEISKIADKIEATTIAGGTSHARQAQRASYTANAVGAAGPPGPQGERALFNTKSSQGYGSWDVVTGQMNKTLDVTKMKDEELPEELRKLKPEERLQIINSKIAERKTAQADLEKLQRQRLDFIKDYSTKNKLDDKNAFDTLVKQALREQAARRNIRFQN